MEKEAAFSSELITDKVSCCHLPEYVINCLSVLPTIFLPTVTDTASPVDVLICQASTYDGMETDVPDIVNGCHTYVAADVCLGKDHRSPMYIYVVSFKPSIGSTKLACEFHVSVPSGQNKA